MTNEPKDNPDKVGYEKAMISLLGGCWRSYGW